MQLGQFWLDFCIGMLGWGVHFCCVRRNLRSFSNFSFFQLFQYSWIERWCQFLGHGLALELLLLRPSKLHFPTQTPSHWVSGAGQKFPDSSRCRVTARYVSGASKRKRRNASKRRRAENQFPKRVLQLGQFWLDLCMVNFFLDPEILQKSWWTFSGELISSLRQEIGESFHDEVFSNFFNVAPKACPSPEMDSPHPGSNTKLLSEFS